MRPAIRGMVLGAIVGIASCSDPNAPCSDVQGIAAVDIGTGNPNAPSAYLAITPGQTVQLSPGSQGGQHIWLQLQARGMCPDHPRVRIQIVRVSDGAVIGTSQFTGTPWSVAAGAAAGTYLSPPYRGVIDPDQYCTVVNGGEVRIEALVDDTAMHVSASSVNVIVRGWSADALPADRTSRELCCADYTNLVCWPHGAPADAPLDAATDASLDVVSDTTADGEPDATGDARTNE